MKLHSTSRQKLIIGAFFAIMAAKTFAGPRYPGNPRGLHDPRGAFDPRGALDPRGVLDPRGALDPRGVFDPRGPFDPRNPSPYMYGLPSGYARRTFAGVNYYYCSGIYYYPFIINGQTVYTRCTIVKGVPVVPARPY